MANWLSRATEGFRKPPPPPPEPYNVRCDCGGTVAGDRVAAAQRPSCPICGRQVFILPVNVYPVTVRPKKPKPPAAESPAADEESTTTSPKADRRHAETAKKSTPPPEPKGILLKSEARLVTPFRAIVVAITIVGSLTLWGLWQRSRIESAKANVLAANEAGMRALNEGDFATAARELTRARKAVDLLHRTDAEANNIRRHCREAVAGNELSETGLFEILAESGTTAGKSKLATRHRDRWVLLDTVIIEPEQANGPCVLDMPLLFEDGKYKVEIDSALVREAALESQAGGEARVLFAAQLSEIRPPSDKDGVATVVLNGKTAFLWTTLETYTSLGYAEIREEQLQATRDLIARQLERSETAK
jgi:hypothetical protein